MFIRKKYSNYLYFRGTMGVVLLFFLIDLLSGNETPYNATFFGVTLFLLVYNIVSPWVTLFKSKRKFFQAGEKLVSRYKDKAFLNTYKLDEEGISYEDDERYYRMKWSLFHPFLIYKDAIVLTSSENDIAFFILHKTQVDEGLLIGVIELLTNTVGRGRDI